MRKNATLGKNRGCTHYFIDNLSYVSSASSFLSLIYQAQSAALQRCEPSGHEVHLIECCPLFYSQRTTSGNKLQCSQTGEIGVARTLSTTTPFTASKRAMSKVGLLSYTGAFTAHAILEVCIIIATNQAAVYVAESAREPA
jgi:hypothetical protein